MTIDLKRTSLMPVPARRCAAGFACLAACLLLSVPTTACADELAANRRRVESMTPAERDQLRQQQARMSQMSPEEREKLRLLDSQLAADPTGDELRRVMHSYYEWLKSQHPAVREELRALGPAARVAKIKELRAEQEQRAAKQLSVEDIAAVRRWSQRWLLSKFTPQERAEWEKAAPERQRAMVFQKAWELARAQGQEAGEGLVKPPEYTAEEIAGLRALLSERAQQHLDGKISLEEQRKLVFGWVGQAMYGSPPGGNRLWKRADRQEMLRFYREELDAQQRRDLDLLPSDQKIHELQRLYFQSKRSKNPQPGPPRPRPFNRDPSTTGEGPLSWSLDEEWDYFFGEDG